jgi:hypothetical protein
MRRIVAVPPPEAAEIIDANREELVQPEFPWIPTFLGRSIAAALAKAQAGTLERPLCGAISRRRDGQLRAPITRPLLLTRQVSVQNFFAMPCAAPDPAT